MDIWRAAENTLWKFVKRIIVTVLVFVLSNKLSGTTDSYSGCAFF